MKLFVAILIFVLALGSTSGSADDGADSISAGGVVVMRREPRITMEKEVLRISLQKVVVDYEFRNDTDHDIRTGVAFPIPDYVLEMNQIDPVSQGFDDFHLWVNGSPVRYKVQAGAFVKGSDVTPLLTRLNLDVASFGHAKSNDDSPEIERLTKVQQTTLRKAGLIDADGAPLWTVRKKYYWTQTFPAHNTVHIRHEYTPVVGSENSIRYGMGPDPDPSSAKQLRAFCIDPKLDKTLRSVAYSKDEDAPYSYVDFILTTANTWKTPIRNFTLIVERPHSKGDLADYVSFCWDGPIKKVDDNHFSATATNFVPKRELHIGFFEVVESSK